MSNGLRFSIDQFSGAQRVVFETACREKETIQLCSKGRRFGAKCRMFKEKNNDVHGNTI